MKTTISRIAKRYVDSKSFTYHRMPVVNNPYAHSAAAEDASEATMGIRSQQRLTQQQRTHRMQQHTTRSRQLTLNGETAFDQIRNCEVCKARHLKQRELHRGHHPLCWNNKRTRGLPKTTLCVLAESRWLEWVNN